MEQQGTDKTNFLKTCEDCGKKFDIVKCRIMAVWVTIIFAMNAIR